MSISTQFKIWIILPFGRCSCSRSKVEQYKVQLDICVFVSKVENFFSYRFVLKVEIFPFLSTNLTI
jgi:hypothetical protein